MDIYFWSTLYLFTCSYCYCYIKLGHYLILLLLVVVLLGHGTFCNEVVFVYHIKSFWYMHFIFKSGTCGLWPEQMSSNVSKRRLSFHFTVTISTWNNFILMIKLRHYNKSRFNLQKMICMRCYAQVPVHITSFFIIVYLSNKMIMAVGLTYERLAFR